MRKFIKTTPQQQAGFWRKTGLGAVRKASARALGKAGLSTEGCATETKIRVWFSPLRYPRPQASGVTRSTRSIRIDLTRPKGRVAGHSHSIVPGGFDVMS
jgi:hypothetical protein